MGTDFWKFVSTAGKLNAIGSEYIFHTVSREVDKEVFIIYLKLTLAEVNGSYPDVLVEILSLVCMRIPAAVRGYESVTVEITVACRITSFIAAILENDISLFVGAIYGLVNEVPDECALDRAAVTDYVPILLKAAKRVTHCMRVFTQDHGTRVVAPLMTLHCAVVGIHRAMDVTVVR